MNTLPLILLPLVTLVPLPSAAAPALLQQVTGSDDLEAPAKLRPIPVASDGLTADEVASKAVEASPSLAGKDADIDNAEAKIGQTMTSFVPQITLSGSYTRLSDVNVTFGSLVGAGNAGLLGVGACPDGSGNQCVVDSAGAPVGAAAFDIPQVLDQFALQAKITVPISDYVLRTFRGLEAAKRSKKAAEVAKEAEARKVAIDARVAYYDWLRTKAQVVATEETMRSTAARLDDVKAAYDAGLRTEADIKRIEALVANAKSANVQARGFEELSRERLSMIMNVPVEEWEVGEDVMDTPPPPPARKLEDAVGEAMANRPELEALDLNQKALDDGKKVAKAGYYPSLNAFAEATYANPNQRYFPLQQEWDGTWSAGLSLTYTINGPLMARQNLREYEAQGRTLDAQEESLRRGIRMEVSQAYIDERTARSRLSLAEASRSASDAAYEVVSIQFAEGNATATDVIEAEGARLDSFIQDYNARIDLRIAQAKLEYATGQGS